MESLRKLIDIVEQGRLPAPMEPTYKKGPGGQLVPDIDVNLNPDMKSTQPRTPAPSTLPPLDAPMEPTYKKGPGGQLVPDIDYKLNPGMKPQSGTAAPPKPASRPQPAAPRTTPKMPTVPQPGAAVKKITEHDIDQEVAAIIEEINKLSTTGVAEGSLDPSGLIAAAAMVSDYIITAEVDGKTKKFRIRGMTGPRAAKERFLKHHSMAKVLDVKPDQGVAEGILGDREYNRVMPFVKRIASEVSDYDRDEFGEELWSLLDQKYGFKFAQSVLQDSLDFYWDEYTELAGQQGVAEGLEDKTAQQRKTERDKQRTAPAQKARNAAQRKGLTQDKDGTYYAKEGVAEGKTVKESKAKPDYIDLDGDGNRKETMKKAAADRKHQKSAK